MDERPSDRPLRVGLVAGEASGDVLGAGLIDALRERHGNIQFFGVAGPRMVAAGCEAWEPAEALAVMGLVEVVRHLPRLLRLRRSLVRRFRQAQPDVVVGIDAPDFNLGLEKRLKRYGIATVHYVSPSVWAWREGRVRSIRAACDRVLCLLPFEPDFYRRHHVSAEFVGHPMADEIPLTTDQAAVRRQLGIPAGPLIAVLPGSRRGEIARLGPIFAATMAWLVKHRPGIQFVFPAASSPIRDLFLACCTQAGLGDVVKTLDGQARAALAAADVTLCASGTATLEATLLKRPMVVAYRVSGLTWFLVATLRWVRVRHVALPNLLADKPFVPEFLQDEARPDLLGPAVLAALDGSHHGHGEWYQSCLKIHRQLRRGASARAASTVLSLINHGR